MVRYLIAAALGCVYVAGSIWIVQREGHSYRASLHESKPPVNAAGTASVVDSGKEKDKSVSTGAMLDLDKPRSDRAASRPASPSDEDDHKKPVVDEPSPARPPTEIAKASPKAAPPENVAAPRPAEKTVLKNPLASSTFWKQEKFAQKWDVTHFRLGDELRLRDQFHELVVRFNPLVEDASPWLSRIEDVAEPLQKMVFRKEIKYNFFILDSDVVNAFSIPGGNVYISRGFFDLVGEDEDYALQFAIGHEMAHVDLEHAIQCLRDRGVMKMPEGTLQKLFTLILPFGYLQIESQGVDQEFAADEWVASRMQRSGRTRREILVFLQKLEGYSRSHGFYEGRIKPQPGRDLSPLENHYRAQTAARKRLKHLKEYMGQAGQAKK